MRNDEARRSVIEKLQQTYATKNSYMDHSSKDTRQLEQRQQQEDNTRRKCKVMIIAQKHHHKGITKDLHDGPSTRVEESPNE
jgi:hypothetical protein